MTFADKYRLITAHKTPTKTKAAPDSRLRAASLRLYLAIRTRTDPHSGQVESRMVGFENRSGAHIWYVSTRSAENRHEPGQPHLSMDWS